MTHKYALTPRQIAVLRALNERLVEASPTEVAVSALLPPNEVRHTLSSLEQRALVNSWVPASGRTGEQVFVLTDEGQAVARALAHSKDVPPVGTVVRVPRALPSFLEWMSSRSPTYVEIVSDGADEA
jgi:DNA-binding MarR family transcriptional regulator